MTASGTWISFDDCVRAGSGQRHGRRPDPTVRDTTGCSYLWGSPTARALGRPPPIRTAPHSRSRRERLVAYSARSRIHPQHDLVAPGGGRDAATPAARVESRRTRPSPPAAPEPPRAMTP